MSLLSMNPGFEPDRLLTMEIQSTGPRYAENPDVYGYHDRVREAVSAVSGVTAAEVTAQLPLGGNFDGYGVRAQDRPLANPELAPSGQRYAVSPGYLSAMRIPLLQGRDFTAADSRENAPRVVIVSAALARRIWGDEDAIGRQIRIGGGDRPWHTVIAVAGDVRHTGLDATDLHGFYIPERQGYWADTYVVLVVRTAVDAGSVAGSVLSAVRSVDPAMPIMNVRTGDEVLAASTAQRRLALQLFAAFALAATMLAAAGVYGVLAGAVAERRREIGIRAVLGASPRAIMNLVVRQGIAPALLGLAIGLAGALALSRYLRAMLFGIEPTDPLTIALTAILLGAVALAACAVPAWNAMRVDPVTTLRSE
jgi:predicted permease